MCAPSRIHTMDRAVVVAHVDKTSCAASLAWVRRCPSALLDSTRKEVSEINEVLAKAVACVHLNLQLKRFKGPAMEDDQIMIKVDTLLEGVM